MAPASTLTYTDWDVGGVLVPTARASANDADTVWSCCCTRASFRFPFMRLPLGQARPGNLFLGDKVNAPVSGTSYLYPHPGICVYVVVCVCVCVVPRLYG
jgi:hypothetical protein